MMAGSYHESKIVPLAGATNGVNRVYTAPSAFVAGTLRVVLNGQVYEPTDDKFGWVETSNTTIEMKVAPIVDDVMAAFYQESSVVPSLDNVKGSPFHPSGALP